jgi:hypothetical protein
MQADITTMQADITTIRANVAVSTDLTSAGVQGQVEPQMYH